MFLQPWQRKALKLYRDGMTSWVQIAKEIQPMLSGLTLRNISEKVRHFITPRLNNIDNLIADDTTVTDIQQTYRSSVEYNQDGTEIHDSLIAVCEGETITPEVVLCGHNLSIDEWEVISYKNNYWHTQIQGGERKVLYQSKVIVKPKVNKISIEWVKEEFKKFDREHTTQYIPQIIHNHTNQLKSEELLVEVNIADLHLGRICYNQQDGRLYDTDYITQVWRQLITDIIQSLNFNISQIDFIWSNDFFNSDTPNKTTIHGTVQDTKEPWDILFITGKNLLIDAIEILSQLAPLKSIYVPANHDMTTSFYASQYLEAWFRNTDNVEIVTNTFPRQYELFGNTLIGWTHGDGKKSTDRDLTVIMPDDFPELWGKSIYREFHAAHLHSEQSIIEKNGVILRRISSPNFNDRWSFQFPKAVRKCQVFVYGKTSGLLQILNIPVALPSK